MRLTIDLNYSYETSMFEQHILIFFKFTDNILLFTSWGKSVLCFGFLFVVDPQITLLTKFSLENERWELFFYDKKQNQNQ